MNHSQAVGNHFTALNAMLQNIILKVTEELETAVSKGTFTQTLHSANLFTPSRYIFKLARSLNYDLQRISK